MNQHQRYMAKAIQLASQAEGRTHPNPMVGCVIVADDRIVGTGYHHAAGTPHAEIHALRQAQHRALGARAYVTLEPCQHYGRTGPCTEAIIQAGIQQVFIGTLDPNPIVHGNGVKRLQQAGISIEVGLLRQQCQALIHVFKHALTQHRPWLIAKMAQTLNGYLGAAAKIRQHITSADAQIQAHHLRDKLDAILVGSHTILRDNPTLTCRLPGGRDPIRIVWDSQAQTPLHARVIQINQTSKAPTWILVGEECNPERRQQLEQVGVRVISCPTTNGKIIPQTALQYLCQNGIHSMLVEGGPSLQAMLFEQHLIDEVRIFLAPQLTIQEHASLSTTPKPFPDQMGLPTYVHLNSISLWNVAETLLIAAQCRYNRPS